MVFCRPLVSLSTCRWIHMHQRKVSIHLIQVVKSAFQPAVFTGKKTNLVQQAMHQSHPKASPHPFLLDGSLCTPGVEWMLRKLMHVRCFHTSASNYETAESQPRHQVKKTSYQQEQLIRKQWLTSTVRENRGSKLILCEKPGMLDRNCPRLRFILCHRPKEKKIKNQLNLRETYKTNLTLQTHDVILWESMYHLNTINRKKVLMMVC